MRCFRVSKQWYGYQCLGYLTCARMLMPAIEHEGCTDTVKESALKFNSGRKFKSNSSLGTRTGITIAPWLISESLYQLRPFACRCVRVHGTLLPEILLFSADSWTLTDRTTTGVLNPFTFVLAVTRGAGIAQWLERRTRD